MEVLWVVMVGAIWLAIVIRDAVEMREARRERRARREVVNLARQWASAKNRIDQMIPELKEAERTGIMPDSIQPADLMGRVQAIAELERELLFAVSMLDAKES